MLHTTHLGLLYITRQQRPAHRRGRGLCVIFAATGMEKWAAPCPHVAAAGLQAGTEQEIHSTTEPGGRDTSF